MTSTNTPSGGPWTSHGHAVAGVTVAGPKPAGMSVARCGGPGLCPQCSQEAASLQMRAARDQPQERPADRNRHIDAYDAAVEHLAALAPYSDWADDEEPDPDAMPETSGPWCGCETCVVREALAAAWPHALAAAADLIESAARAVDVETGARGRFVGLLREEARKVTLPGRAVPA